MNKTLLMALAVAAWWPLSSMADSLAWRCVYTEATYSAAFMARPETRSCPQSRCFYDILFDTDAGRGVINGTAGYTAERSANTLVLRRSAPNVVMGGTDTAEFVIDTGTLNFTGRKSTAPSVTVATRGQCSAI